MTKNNPLFVDSTKFHGDLISTHIELRNVMIYDNEALFVVVTNHQGVTRRLPMKLMDERSFEARLHLNHQMPVTYQFIVEKDGERFLSSPTRKGRAQYALIEEWQPVLNNETDLVSEEAVEAPVTPPKPMIPTQQEHNEAWARESVMNVKNLMEKWGL